MVSAVPIGKFQKFRVTVCDDALLFSQNDAGVVADVDPPPQILIPRSKFASGFGPPGPLADWDPQRPTGVASQRKLANVNLRTQTCDGWRNGLGSRRKFNASSKKAISVRPCTRARTKENNSEINLRLLALGGHTVKSLRSLVCKVELDQSER